MKNQETVDRILAALDKADLIERWGPAGLEEADWFTGSPEKGEDATVMSFDDGSEYDIASLREATINMERNSFYIGGVTFRPWLMRPALLLTNPAIS